jgi:FKBP-type peptidyl-prolyl cis-trans isomerase 2
LAKKKKQSKLVWVIIVLLIAGGIWYMGREEAPPVPVPEPAPTGAQEGDMVAINFVLAMPNGTVIDTNNESLAKEFGVKNYVKGPFRFIIGQSGKLVGQSGKFRGFDETVIGMEPGQTATKLIEPSEPVLEYVINRTRTVVRNQAFPTFGPVPLKKFSERFNREPRLNDVIVNPDLPWPVKVFNITEKYVIVEALAEQGKSYTLPGFEWKSLLLVKSKNDMLFRHNPADGQIITTEFGPAVVRPEPGRLNITYQIEQDDIVQYGVPVGENIPASIPYDFMVTSATDDQFTLRRINYPSQESLVMTVEVLEWTQDVEKVTSFNKE